MSNTHVVEALIPREGGHTEREVSAPMAYAAANALYLRYLREGVRATMRKATASELNRLQEELPLDQPVQQGLFK